MTAFLVCAFFGIVIIVINVWGFDRVYHLGRMSGKFETQREAIEAGAGEYYFISPPDASPYVGFRWVPPRNRGFRL